jgi:hypothetical protein
MDMLLVYSVLGWSVYTLVNSIVNPFNKKCNLCNGFKRLRIRS